LLYPRVTYHGPAHPPVEVPAAITDPPSTVEPHSNRLWRGDFGVGRKRIYDRHPRLSLSLGAEPPKRRQSLNEAAHKVYRGQ
jgi:hypothetical protein